MAVAHFPNSIYLAERALEFFQDEFYNDPMLSEVLTVVPDINNKKQVIYLKSWDKVVLADRGCGDNLGDDKAIIDQQKYWDPKPLEAWIRLCQTDLVGKVSQYLVANGNDRPKSEAVMNIALDILKDAIQKDTLRQAWFNEVASAAYGDGGKLALAKDIPNYKEYDGLFVQISNAIISGLIKNTTISENALATTALQTALADDKAIDIMETMYESMDSRGRGKGVWLMTNELFFNYRKTLRKRDVESSKVQIENGFSSLSFEGNKVINMDIWSRYIASDFRTDASSLYNPNRIVYAPLSEIMAGFDVLPDNKIETWYDQSTKYNHARSSFVGDAKIGREYLITTAGCQ